MDNTEQFKYPEVYKGFSAVRYIINKSYKSIMSEILKNTKSIVVAWQLGNIKRMLSKGEGDFESVCII